MSLAASTSLTGLVVVRGGGSPVVQRRLPRRSAASVGRRDRHAFELQQEWVPKDLGTFTPVEEGWIFVNHSRAWMRVESDFILTGSAVFRPEAMVMLQRGDHRVSWEGLGQPLGVSLTIRTRRLEDQRVPYAVDSTVDGHAPVEGSYLGVTDAPMTAALRYRLAVLFQHLLHGEAAPRHWLDRRAEALGVPAEELDAAAHRYRRRLNVVRSLDLQSLEELGEYLVLKSEELTKDDLQP
jgi:hypothetical protein